MNILKRWYFGLVLCFIVVIVILLLQNTVKGVGTAGISKEEFDEIIIGKTTNFGANKIIDKNNEWDDDKIYSKCVEEISQVKEDHKYTYVYKYYGEKGGYAIITMQADYSNGYFYNDIIVIKKESFNLK